MSLLSGLGLGIGVLPNTASAQQAQGLTQSQLAAQATAMFNSAYQKHQSQYSQAHIANLGLPMYPTAAQWMIAGQVMTFDQFVDTLYPEDCAEKTYLILKFKGTENDTSN